MLNIFKKIKTKVFKKKETVKPSTPTPVPAPATEFDICLINDYGTIMLIPDKAKYKAGEVITLRNFGDDKIEIITTPDVGHAVLEAGFGEMNVTMPSDKLMVNCLRA